MINFLGGLASVIAIITFIAATVRAFYKTDIEILLMSPSNTIVNRIMNITFFCLLLIVISNSLLISNKYYREDFWYEGLGVKMIVITLIISLIFLGLVMMFLVLLKTIRKSILLKNLLLITSNIALISTTILTVICFMFVSSAFYTWYETYYIEETDAIPTGNIPLQILLSCIFIYITYSITTLLLYSIVRNYLDKDVIITEVKEASHIFKDGMKFLYSIAPDVQVVTPVTGSTSKTTYPQYVYYISSDKIIKYDVSPSNSRFNNSVKYFGKKKNVSELNKHEHVPGTTYAKRSSRHKNS